MEREMLERLNQALKIAGSKVGYSKKSEIAAFLGYTPGHYSEVINGKTPLTEDFLGRVKEYLNINSDWIRMGEGHIFLDDHTSTIAADSSIEAQQGKTVPYFMYQDLLKKYEAVLRENETLRNKLDDKL